MHTACSSFSLARQLTTHLIAMVFLLLGVVPALPLQASDGDQRAQIIEEFDESFDEAWVNDSPSDCCDNAFCSGCSHCRGEGIFQNKYPPGLLQRFFAEHSVPNSRWSAEVDAVLLWRNAPPARSLVRSIGASPSTVLDAAGLESTPAAGPRFRILHSHCSGAGAEFVYLRAFNFRALDSLPSAAQSIYSPDNLLNQPAIPFADGTANLGSAIQTFEANGRTPSLNRNIFFLAGFRWLEWQEHFSLDTATGTFATSYNTSTVNSLYGGQLGLEALLFTSKACQIDTFFKGGAYYNNVGQHTSYLTNVPGAGSVSTALSAAPASGAFVGELGINGSILLNNHARVRFGYTAFWLENIALATQQLTDPNTLVSNGNTILQGVQLGFEGSW